MSLMATGKWSASNIYIYDAGIDCLSRTRKSARVDS